MPHQVLKNLGASVQAGPAVCAPLNTDSTCQDPARGQQLLSGIKQLTWAWCGLAPPALCVVYPPLLCSEVSSWH